ncbi:MAG: hypothetical protein O2916_11100 [Proteobacteria bacterium]|jgi:hypothetical protein|nr:hypothetical protein [Pseudomonadota bacterium]
MRKVVMIIGLLSVLATSAQAGYWQHTPTFGGGSTSRYVPEFGDSFRSGSGLGSIYGYR